MKILFKYLQPYKWLVILTLGLAGINIGFSLIDPILLGKMVNLANEQQSVSSGKFNWSVFFWNYEWITKKGTPIYTSAYFIFWCSLYLLPW